MAEAEAPKWVPPPKIEDLFAKTAGNQFAAINAPTAGPRQEVAREVGPGGDASKAAPLQLYSLATPNGHKVSILLEELDVPYDAHTIMIGKGEQFTTGFVGATPNSKIPALIDHDGPGGKPLSIMESAAIDLYLCEKYPEKGLMPTDPRLRSEALQWIFWQMGGQGPMTGNFGHFMVYAPAHEVDARNYGVARYGMEVQRLSDVLERHLAGYGDFAGSHEKRPEGPRTYLVGDQYSVADIIVFPWVKMLWGPGYNRDGQPTAKDFLGMDKYTNIIAWMDRISARPAVQRGLRVCRWDETNPKPWLDEQKE